MELKLTTGQYFLVPLSVPEYFLKLATHDQLKVLLYLLSHTEDTISDTEIAKTCNVRVEAVEEAVHFWKQVNVLSDASTPVRTACAAVVPETVPAPAPPQPLPEPPIPAKPVDDGATGKPAPRVQATSGNYLMPSEIAARKGSDPDMAAVLSALEQQAGRMLTHAEFCSLFWMRDYLGLAPDVLLMLAAYCISNETFQVRYMEKIAVDWQERGVTTHEQAQQDIQRRAESRSYTGRVMKLFEMKRRPTPKQQQMIDEWQTNQDSLEMIELAYQMTRDRLDDRLDFHYLNAILKHWRQEGIHTPAQVDAAQEAFLQQLLGDAGDKGRPKRGAAGKSSATRGKATSPAQEEHSYALDDFKALMNQF